MTTEHDLHKVRLLAVDDSDEDCSLNRAILEGAGYKVDTAPNIRAARTLLQDNTYGVLLVDLRLPDGDGLDLLEAARRKDPHSVAVVLTAYRQVETTMAAIQAHAYDFLSKPCSSDRIVGSVDRAAERYLLTKALYMRNLELEESNKTLDRRVRDATAEIFGLNEKLKKVIEELTEAYNTQNRFLNDMAHELKNPLSVIWGYSSFILRRPVHEWKEADLKRSLESIQRNAVQIQQMIEELLDSSRIEGQRITIRKARFPAKDAVREAAEGMRCRAEDKGVDLTAEYPEDGLTVFADPNRLRQILVNLITNAIKFTPEGGHVQAKVFKDRDRTHFVIKDTGPGLDGEQAKKIFNRFYQVDTRQKEEGLGLGLYICAGLIKMHQGRIWVESEPGQGAEFHFVLPTTVRKETPATTQALSPKNN